MSKELVAVPQLNAPAVSVASLTTGMATALDVIPAIAGSISSIAGLFLAFYLIKHRRTQIRIDEMAERKAEIDMEISERTLARLKDEDMH